MVVLVDVVRKTEFFRDLDDNQFGRVSDICQLTHFRKGTTIYEIGDPSRGFFILVDGKVRFTIGLGAMSTSAGQIIRCGEVFGWAALLSGEQPRLATAQCVTDAQVIAMPGLKLLALMEADHTLGYRLMQRLNALISGRLVNFAAA